MANNPQFADAAAPWDENLATFTLFDPVDKGRLSDVHNIFRREVYEGIILPSNERFMGTVAIRCRFCKHCPEELRAPQSIVHPRSLEQMQRAHVRFHREHFRMCKFIPKDIKARVERAKANSHVKNNADYWVSSARDMGLDNAPEGILVGRL
jgi:hypothetical protein